MNIEVWSKNSERQVLFSTFLLALQLLLEKFEKFEKSALAEKRKKEKEALEKQEFLKKQLESEKRRREEGFSIEEVTEEQAKQIESEIENVSPIGFP